MTFVAHLQVEENLALPFYIQISFKAHKIYYIKKDQFVLNENIISHM